LDLFILRHGEAGQRVSAGRGDFQRPLTAAGQKEVSDIATSLKDLGIKLDIVITSPLKRAHQTASIVAKIFKIEKKMQDWAELSPEGNRLDLYNKLSQLKQQSSVLVVGHEPNLSGMISEMIFDGKNNGGRITLKKSGLVKIRIISSTPKFQGELKWLLTPKLLKNMSSK
jgi:phosphohistidine phosphatase